MYTQPTHIVESVNGWQLVDEDYLEEVKEELEAAGEPYEVRAISGIHYYQQVTPNGLLPAYPVYWCQDGRQYGAEEPDYDDSTGIDPEIDPFTW